MKEIVPGSTEDMGLRAAGTVTRTECSHTKGCLDSARRSGKYIFQTLLSGEVQCGHLPRFSITAAYED